MDIYVYIERKTDIMRETEKDRQKYKGRDREREMERHPDRKT